MKMSAFHVLLSMLPMNQAAADETSLKAMQQRVESVTLAVANERQAKPQLVAAPVFRYSDELRHIEDAGIWLWTDRGRPTGAMKVEYYKAGVHPRPWLYCFSSLSPTLVTVDWPGERTFSTRKPGVTWQPIADVPAKTRAARLVQMREIARRFSAEILRNPEKLERHQMRLLTRPLYRYEETVGDAADGAVFGFTGTGTNPDLLLVVDLEKDAGWRFGFTGMTAEGLVVKLGDQKVWELAHSIEPGQKFETWVYFSPKN